MLISQSVALEGVTFTIPNFINGSLLFPKTQPSQAQKRGNYNKKLKVKVF